MNTLYSPFNGYVLRDAVFTGTAPADASYALSEYTFFKPNWRVVYAATSVNVVCTAGASRLGDVFALPMHNITPGSTTILNLTNGTGLNVNIPVPSFVPSDGVPLTVVCDLRPLANIATRTASVWTVVVTTNGANVTLGAMIWIGTLIEFTRDYVLGAKIGEKRFNTNTQNNAGSTNKVRWRTRERYVNVSVPAASAQYDQILDWMRAGEGSWGPSLLWPFPPANDALVGSFEDQFEATEDEGMKRVTFKFTEFTKGPPLL